MRNILLVAFVLTGLLLLSGAAFAHNNANSYHGNAYGPCGMNRGYGYQHNGYHGDNDHRGYSNNRDYRHNGYHQNHAPRYDAYNQREPAPAN